MEHEDHISEGYAIGFDGQSVELDETSDQYIEEFEDKVFEMKKRYNEALLAKVGDNIACACCGMMVIKTTYHKKFCNNQKKTKRGVNSCKDKYWNTVDENRRRRSLN
jgi:hypothetical protein